MHTKEFEIISLHGNQKPIYMPAGLGISEDDIGKAIFAWIFDLKKEHIAVLELMIQGEKIEAIAETLNCEERTVKNYINFMKSKLGTKSRDRLIAIAVRFGLDTGKILVQKEQPKEAKGNAKK